MEQEWNPVNLDIMPYKETGTYIMKIGEELSQLLDDHIVMTQSMSFSPYKKVFEDRINNWDNKLQMTQDVIDEWLMCQRSWLYLEPIFRYLAIFLFVTFASISPKFMGFWKISLGIFCFSNLS